MSVRCQMVWPIAPYTGGAIKRLPLATALADPNDPGAQAALTDWVNHHQPVVVEPEVRGQPPYTSIVRASIPSIEGERTYEYLAVLTAPS